MGRLVMPNVAVTDERAEVCAALLENRRLVNIGRRGDHYCRQFVRDPRTGIILASTLTYSFLSHFSVLLS